MIFPKENTFNTKILSRHDNSILPLAKPGPTFEPNQSNMADFDHQKRRESKEGLNEMRENSTMSVTQQLLHSFAEVYSESTMHGLPRVISTSNWIVRVFWLICFLGGLAASAYFTYLSTKSFFNYEVTVSLSENEDSPSDFPAVNK